MIILQIIGGIVLTVVVIALLTYLYFRVKFGKYLYADDSREPLSINLNEDVSPEWLSDKKAKALVNELEDLGYRSGPAYSIYEMENVYLQPFFKKPLIAVVYWHKSAGSWVDIVTDVTGNKEYTFSNAPMGGGMEQRPECNKLFRPTASVSELHLLAEDVVKNAKEEFRIVDENNFREYFESFYKKDITWKNRKGGITFDEFTKAEKEAPFSSSKKNIEKAFIQFKVDELDQWHEAALEEYRRSQNINEEDFYELEYKLIIVPFTSYATAYLEYLEERGFIKENQLKKLANVHSKETDMQILFDKINNLLSPKLRAKEVGKYSFPLELKIYRLSDQMCN